MRLHSVMNVSNILSHSSASDDQRRTTLIIVVDSGIGVLEVF
jgi:hypothetical protein